MSTPSTILEVRDLRFAHPGQALLFDGWSIALGAGVTLVQGDTGSGKTTLLRLLAGREHCAGRLTLAGIALNADAGAYREQVCWLDPTDPAHDALIAGAAMGAAAQVHAEGFALTPHLHKPLYMLSTGSRRKVWLAAALASTCPLVLLDEPAAALDGPSRAHLLRALAEPARGRAIVVASADTLGDVPLAGTVTLPLQGA